MAKLAPGLGPRPARGPPDRLNSTPKGPPMATDTRTTGAADGATVLRGITWKTYLRLRDNPSNYRVRMSYLDGTLILMSPQFTHDNNSRRLALVVDMVAWVHRIPHLGTMTTTLRRKGPGPRKGTG